MNHSVSCTVIITSATEDKIKRDFGLIFIRLLRRRVCWKLNTQQEYWIKCSSIKRFSIYDISDLTSSNISSTLSKISCVYRRIYRVLREGCIRLLIRRTVSTYFIIARSITLMTRSITVPRSNLRHTLCVIYSNLIRRYQLQPNTGNTTFIKESGQIGILRYLRKNFHSINSCSTSIILS